MMCTNKFDQSSKKHLATKNLYLIREGCRAPLIYLALSVGFGKNEPCFTFPRQEPDASRGNFTYWDRTPEYAPESRVFLNRISRFR